MKIKLSLLVVLVFILGVAVATNPYQVSTLQAPSTRFGVANFCNESVTFVFKEDVSSTGSLPANIRLSPGYEYDVPLNSGSSYVSFVALPKILCDESGNDCVIGEESATGTRPIPQPAIDTIFEATFASNGTANSYDLSTVNGTTIPAVVKVFQATDESNGACTDVDAGNVPYPPVLLNPSDQNYHTEVESFYEYCQSGSGESNSFLTPFIYNPQENSFFVGTVRDVESLMLFTPAIQNPYFESESTIIAARGGNPESTVIGCAAPGRRLDSIPPASESWAADGMGTYHPQDFENGGTGNAWDSNVIMISCPFASTDVTNVINSQSLSNYLAVYDESQNLPSSNSPLVQLVNHYKNGTESSIFNPSPGVYSASLMCKNGPLNTNYWTTEIHSLTNFTYAYTYDDSTGGRGCSDSGTKLVFVACGKFNQGY